LHGKKVIYLGQNVPYENLTKVINSCKLTHVYTFYVRHHSEENVEKQIGKLLKENKNLKVCLSGRQNIIENILKKYKVTWVRQVESLIEMLK
jgi:flavorubredoxin